MILWRQQQRGPPKAELERRMDLFQNRSGCFLLEEARHSATGFRRKPNPLTPEEELVRRGRQAEKFVHQGEVSRARQALCSQARAPGTAATSNELRRLSQWKSADFGLSTILSWTRRSTQATSAVHRDQGWASDTNEHYKVLIDDEEATLLITEAAEHLSKADLPIEIADALAMGAMTALMKDNGRIRGIVTGDTFLREVARTMAQQCALKFERACMPFQYALSTRAGTDCVARVVKSLTELDPRKTLLSIDGIGAFDHIKRKAMMEALHTDPQLASLLPFVRLFHGKDSRFVWYDDDGLSHETRQGEGGRAGRPSHASLVCSGSARSSLTSQCHLA